VLSTPVGAAVLRPNDVSPKLIRRGPFAQRSSRAGGPSVGAQYLRDGDVVALEFTGLAGGGGRLRLGAIRVDRRLRPRKRLRGSRIRRTPRAAPDASLGSGYRPRGSTADENVPRARAALVGATKPHTARTPGSDADGTDRLDVVGCRLRERVASYSCLAAKVSDTVPVMWRHQRHQT
jgi:hypothetical protein